MDELQFEVGEIINVIPYEDEEEQVKKLLQFSKRVFRTLFFVLFQEEGWLMGQKDSDGSKGMFPANFTRPV